MREEKGVRCAGREGGEISGVSKERKYPPPQAILSPPPVPAPSFSFLMKLSDKPILGLGAQLWSTAGGASWLPAQSNLVN